VGAWFLASSPFSRYLVLRAAGARSVGREDCDALGRGSRASVHSRESKVRSLREDLVYTVVASGHREAYLGLLGPLFGLRPVVGRMTTTASAV
jgi:hypothetical protein